MDVGLCYAGLHLLAGGRSCSNFPASTAITNTNSMFDTFEVSSTVYKCVYNMYIDVYVYMHKGLWGGQQPDSCHRASLLVLAPCLSAAFKTCIIPTQRNHARGHMQIHEYIHTNFKYIYMHACMHACMHAYIHTYIRTKTHIRAYVRTYVRTCVRMYVQNTNVYRDICMSTYIYTYTCTTTYLHVHM